MENVKRRTPAVEQDPEVTQVEPSNVARIVLGQHEYERVKDKDRPLDKRSTLDEQLSAYRRAGRRVLSYWRAGRSWIFKLSWRTTDAAQEQ